MTTETPTLADFLLARIAEDEASAMNWSRFGVRGGIPGNYAIPERVLADCKAKRAIIEREHVECAGHPGSFLPHADYGPGLCWRADEYNATLLALAAIYAGHKDYRSEWAL